LERKAVPDLQELHDHAQELTKATGVVVEIIERETRVYILLHNVTLPTGAFQLAETDVLFITDRQYPLSALDMFWTEVGVVRSDGSSPQNASSIETHLERKWRCFSWHRNGVWNPARNGLLDHFVFMEARFAEKK
jgi:hypothetical protein